MVVHFDKSFCKLIAVNVDKSRGKFVRNAHVRIADVFEGVSQDIVSLLVVSEVLLLDGNAYCNLDCLADIADRTVEFKSPLRFFGHVVSFSHEVVDQFMGQRIKLDSRNHIDHSRDHAFSIRHVEFQRFAVLLGSIVVTRRFAPLLLALVVLSDFQVFILVFVIVFEHDFGVFIHLLVRLSNHKCVFALASKD